MNWTDALAVVLLRTGHARYSWLCSEDNPDAAQREGYRRLMLELAGAPAPDPAPDPNPTPADLALREYVIRHGGCCH